jgi:excisionase family DNA binding protein
MKWCYLLGGKEMSDALQHQDGKEPPRFYSVDQTAQILGISKMTVYRAIHDGSFPAIRVRGRFAVPAKAIDDMEASAIKTRSVVETADWMERTRH